MPFVDDYQRLKTALAQQKPTSEQIDTFIKTLNNLWSQFNNQQPDNHQSLDNLDQQLLDLYLAEAGKPADYKNLSSLGQVMLPFLAIDLQRAMGERPCRLMTQLRGTGVIRGNEQDYLSSDFAEILFTSVDLPLALRHTLFDRLQAMTSIGHLKQQNLVNELGKLRFGERLLTLAHLHRLDRLKNFSNTERKNLRSLLGTNDPLVEELVTEWGLKDSRFNWQALQTHLSHYFSRRSRRTIRLILGKYFFLTVITLLWSILLLTTFFQWLIMYDLKEQVADKNAEDIAKMLLVDEKEGGNK